ncbi:MAG TPA: tetratricopeptide repeat protein [Terriglobales bacterium]|nr:tetratricopeptide repeat protein [Terriglobales bacterium]
MRKLLFVLVITITTAALAQATGDPAITARDRSDAVALSAIIAGAQKSASDTHNFDAQMRLAQLDHWMTEVSFSRPGRAGLAAAAGEEVKAAEAAVALRPQSAEAHARLGIGLSDAISADPSSAMTDGPRSMEEFSAALRLDPKNADAKLGAAIGLLFTPAEYGGDVKEAVAQMRQAVALAPMDDTAHLWLAQALAKDGQPAAALAEVNAALAIDPNRDWTKMLRRQWATAAKRLN